MHGKDIAFHDVLQRRDKSAVGFRLLIPPAIGGGKTRADEPFVDWCIELHHRQFESRASSELGLSAGGSLAGAHEALKWGVQPRAALAFVKATNARFAIDNIASCGHEGILPPG